MDSGYYTGMPTTFGEGQINGYRMSSSMMLLKVACIRENSSFLFLINMTVRANTSTKNSVQSVTILRNLSVTELICLFVGIYALFYFCGSLGIVSGCHVHFCCIPLTV